MKKGKHARKKYRIIEAYSVLILIATLFMSIGYAQISGIEATIEGEVEATVQEGVFVTDVVNTANNNADITNSKINYYIDTTLDSEIVLGDTSDSSITYQVTLYNNSNIDYIFIGTITDKKDTTLYSNSNIEFNIEGLQEYTTTIAPNESLSFTITFKYTDDADISKNILTSKLNFRFKEIPKLELSNDGETYTLNDIYPDYTPQEYEFTVSNYDKTGTSSVPMKYYFETTIDSPLAAKIYDKDGKEVTESITIDGDGKTQIDNAYTLKIIWDDSQITEYNSIDYADNEFKCSVVLKSSPIDEKYMGYTITKQFDVNIKTASFSFNANPSATSISIKNNSASLSLGMNNYMSDTVYNKFDVTYEISMQGNDDFTFTVGGESPTNNVITKTLSGGSKTEESLDIKFTADMSNLDITETLTLKVVVTKSPYTGIEEIEIPITVTLHTTTVTLNANGGSVSPSTFTVYQTRTYDELPNPTRSGHDFNGWYTAATGGTKIEKTTTVTTDSEAQTLYAQWTSRLLADYVSVGDYVNYEVYYTNVATANSGTTNAATSDYTGWRVLGVGGSGDNKYVKLITAGVPLTYVHSSSSGGAASVTKITTNFLSTSIKSTATNQYFHLCGFKTDSTLKTSVTTIDALKTLFKNNTYTQQVNSVPQVRAPSKTEIDLAYYGDANGDGNPDGTSTNETSFVGNDLIAVPSSDGYATYYLATANPASNAYLWCIYWEGAMVYSSYERGVRPVVLLETTVETTGQVDDVWQLK